MGEGAPFPESDSRSFGESKEGNEKTGGWGVGGLYPFPSD